MLFGCNELGFSKANVSAIYDINQSTKTLLKEGKKGCIGEKGIGFKSVFKVTDKVWISSNNFPFMFDKTTPLGMVDPVWNQFPDFPEQLHMNTMICLKIEKQTDRDVVREQLTKVLEPSSFMFLRRLSKTRVVRLDDSGDTFDELVMSHDHRPFTDDLELVTTTRSKGTKSWKSRYLLSDYIARGMPSTELRQGVTETSIKLAFPLNNQQQPLIAKQDVYAFLPICSSGLPFLIQAGFLLVASRQGIDGSQPWNRRLQDHIVLALIQAFQRLNDTRLKYLWPAYLPEAQVALKFFDKIKDKFLDRVKPAGAMLSSTRKPVADTPPEMVTDDGNSDSGDSDLSSLAALKEIGVRVKLVRKPKPVTAPRSNTQSRSGRANALPQLSTDDNAMEHQSDDEDWEKDWAPMSNRAAPSRRSANISHSTGHRMRSSYFENSIAISDEDINDIDSEMSEGGTDTAQQMQAFEYRKQLNAVENTAEDPQVIRIGEQGEMKVRVFNLHPMVFTSSTKDVQLPQKPPGLLLHRRHVDQPCQHQIYRSGVYR